MSSSLKHARLFSAEELKALLTRLGYPFAGALIPKTIDYYLRRTSHMGRR